MMEISEMKVTDLKEELSKRGLPLTGLKAELVKRLQDAVTQDDRTEPAEPQPPTSPKPSTETTPPDPSSLLKPTSPDPLSDPDHSAQGVPRAQTPPPSVQAAADDDTVAIDDNDMQEQIMGDTDGDLGEVMRDAEREGKEERERDEQQEEEGKVDEMNDEEGVGQPSDAGTTATGAEAGEKRKRANDSFGMDVDGDGETDERAKKARTGEGEMQQDERREDEPASTPFDPFEEAPNPLPHTRHPPTRALYIDNFRRPLDLPALRELLEDQGELDDSDVKTGVWVSGVKSHVYVVYKSEGSATKAALALHELEFQPISRTKLHVEFVPSNLVPSLIEKEEAAWKEGRKQMNLVIQTVPHGEGHEGTSRKVEVVLAKTGGVGVQGRRVPGLANAPPPPTPFRARPGVAGIGGTVTVPPRVTGPVGAVPSRYDIPQGKTGAIKPGAAQQDAPARETRGFLRTRTRPVLFYREAPRK